MLTPEDPPRRLLKITQVADEINVTERTVRAMIKDGRLKARRAGRIIRIDPADLDAALKPYGGSVRADGEGPPGEESEGRPPEGEPTTTDTSRTPATTRNPSVVGAVGRRP